MSESQQKKLVILRGISGSGKSTLAKQIMKESKLKKDEIEIFSSDDFFMDEQGNYNFKSEKLGRAHEWNQRRAQKAMEKGMALVIVDNTNTQKWEAKPYVEQGVKNKYEIEIREPQTKWAKDARTLAQKNKHNVPLKSIRRMLARWENDFTVENILKAREPKQKRRRKNNNGNRPDMIQVVLTKEARTQLQKICPPKYEKQFAQHVTLAFKPKDQDVALLMKDGIEEGCDVDIHVDLWATSKEFSLEAIRVKKMVATKSKTEVISLNEVAHITLSLDPSKRKPVDSNKLMKLQHKDLKTKDVDSVLKGKLTFVRWNR